MNFEEADGNKPNPNFGKEEQYNTNCQTCVVAYEARRRGYNVEALGNTSGSLSEILSKSTNKAWIDPKIGKHPDYIKCGIDSDIDTPKKYVEFLEKILKENTRYTMGFGWKKAKYGHIVHVYKDSESIKIYDPQTGIIHNYEFNKEIVDKILKTAGDV